MVRMVRSKSHSLLDLLRNYFRNEMFRFRARRSKNYEVYTAYTLNNFSESLQSEIRKLQPKNDYAAGLVGQGLLEIIIAMAVFGIIASALASLSLGGFKGLTQGGQRTAAEIFAQQGMEAVRAIRDRAWNENISGPTGVQIQTNQWRFSGTQDVTPPPVYTRIIRFNPVCRNPASVVVACTQAGAVSDIQSREVVVSVTWTTPYGAANMVEKRALITNWNSREWQENSMADFADGTFGADSQASSQGD